MSSDENDNEHILTLSSNDESTTSSDKEDTSSEAAGVVRGLARSFKGMMRFPGVGSLPRRAVLKRRLPVQRVASVSDRLSTGIDLFQTAVETEEASTRLKRVTTFVKSVVKNTLLGAAVFETYEYMVTYLAPERCQPQMNHKDNVDHARASLGSHFLAGACGGFVHAIPSTFWESTTSANSGVMSLSSRATLLSQYLPAMIIHHSIAHSVLFGCYESIKREFLRDEQQSRHDEIPYFCSVSMAGGLAGQIQHVISHYTEQWLLLGAETTTRPRPLVRFVASPPTLRPTLFAFPPSAISFVAFEYGKRILT